LLILGSLILKYEKYDPENPVGTAMHQPA